MNHVRRDRICLVCGPLVQLFVFLFLAILHLLPPISSSQDPTAVVEHYSRYQNALEADIDLFHLSSVFWPFYAVGINNS